jgi:hypothetical protein
MHINEIKKLLINILPLWYILLKITTFVMNTKIV